MVWWAASFATAAVFAAILRYLYLRFAFRPSAAQFLQQLARLENDQLPGLAKALPSTSNARALLEAKSDAADAAESSALMDEALLDIEGKLLRGAGVPRSAAKVSILSGNAFAVLGLLAALPQPNLDDLLRIALALVLGTFGALVCGYCARLAARERQKQADGWYEAVRRLSGDE